MFSLVCASLGCPALPRIWSSMTNALFHFLIIFFRIAPRLIGVPKCLWKSIKHCLLDETFNILSITKFHCSSARHSLINSGNTGPDVGSHFYHISRTPQSLVGEQTSSWSIICRFVFVPLHYHLWFGCYNYFVQYTSSWDTLYINAA